MSDALAAVKRIGTEIAARHALAVDAEARFPIEAITALREAKLLSASVPVSLGGAGLGLPELSALCTELGRHCAATSMVFAMHHIQVGCLARHGGDWFQDYLRELVKAQWLIASVTSEVGTSGDLRSSVAGVTVDGDGFALEKAATTVSYGAHADDWLITCKRAPDAAPSDQVMVLARRDDTTLSQTGAWATLGMRGTCSPGFVVKARGRAAQIVPDFPNVASRTMVPFSHCLWGGTWLGIAADAVGRARAYVRGEARKKPGTTPPTALRTAEVATQLMTMRATVESVCRDVQALYDGGNDEALATVGWALRLNQLKIGAAQLVIEIVTKALAVVGIAGYRTDTPFSLGRHLRDAHSAPLMIANDRMQATNAALLCVFKDD